MKHLRSHIADLNDLENFGGTNAPDGRALIAPIGRISLAKAFQVPHSKFKLVYVTPSYDNYRYATKKVFSHIPRGFDVDHLLARKLALRSGFQYVLVGRVRACANRAHGYSERPKGGKTIALIPTCHADERIALKAIGKPPVSYLKYKPTNTVVQITSDLERGAWAFALGVDPLRHTTP
jgi:hypothetical protein